MAEAEGRTVFVLGREVDGNRQVVIVEDGEEYNFDIDTMTAYTAQTARFPYEV
jgi:predicted RNA-binding protein with TRAM domain